MRNLETGTANSGSVVHAEGEQVTSLAYGNGKTLSQTFDLRYRPSAVASGPLLLGYGVTPAGDVKRIDDSSQVLSGCYRNTFREFKYDFLDRLTEAPGRLSYGYDGGGNRTAEAVEGAAASYAYAAGTDRVSKELVSGVARYAFGYDRQANLSAIGRYDAAGASIQQAVCLRHDALGRMVLYGTRSASGVSPDATVCTTDAEVTSALARFRYDARNRRVARQDAATGSWTHTISDPSGNPLSELSLVAGAWVKVRDYVWLDGRPLAQIEYPTSTTTYAYYLHLDHIGLPRAMTNQSGQLVWNTFPRPYGDIAERTMTDPLSGRVVVTNLRLPGQYDERLLGSLGLQGPYYNWNRWYLPGVGRYAETDPLLRSGKRPGATGSGWYAYASGNPGRYTDHSGLQTDSEVMACLLHPLDCIDARNCADEALAATRRRFGHQGGDDASDAFRHCYWSCCMTQRIGAGRAQTFGDAHENSPDNPQCSQNMDLHNNQVGRELGSSGADCESMCAGSPKLQDRPTGPCTPCGSKRYGNYYN